MTLGQGQVRGLRIGPMGPGPGPWAQDRAHGHRAQGTWVHGPMGSWAQGPMGPRPTGPGIQKHEFYFAKHRFSIRRQRAGTAPGKDNSTPAEDLHNKNPSLAPSGKINKKVKIVSETGKN